MSEWTSDLGIVVFYEEFDHVGFTFVVEVAGKAAYTRLPWTEETATDAVNALLKTRGVSKAWWRYDREYSTPVGG